MQDILLHVAVGIKNDGLSQEAGATALSAMLQDQVADSLMNLSWVTDVLVTSEQVGEAD